MSTDLTQSSLVTPTAEDEAIATKNAEAKLMSAAQTKAIEAVVEQRPLAKMQEKLDKDAVEAEAAGEKGDAKPDVVASASNGGESGANVSGGNPGTRPKSRIKHQMLLHNSDYELMRIEAVCTLYVLVTGILTRDEDLNRGALPLLRSTCPSTEDRRCWTRTEII